MLRTARGLSSATAVSPANTVRPTSPWPANPTIPPLHHTRTAPTTFPILPVAHLPGGDNLLSKRTSDSDEESSTATLIGNGHGNGTTVPAEVGGLHGYPMPGSKHYDNGIASEEDHQAGTQTQTDGVRTGITGRVLAQKAAADLGSHTQAQSRDDQPGPLPSIPSPGSGTSPKTGQTGQTGTGTRAIRSSTLSDEKRYSPYTKLDRTATGTLGMFVSLFNYIVDVYLWVAASALAGTTVARSICGFGFPLFAPTLYRALGPQWASSLLGFLALLLAPIPIVLTIYGEKLRKRSRFSPT